MAQALSQAERDFRDAVRKTTEVVVYHRRQLLAATADAFSLSNVWGYGTEHYVECALELDRLGSAAFMAGNPYIPPMARAAFVRAWIKAIDDLMMSGLMQFDLYRINEDEMLGEVCRGLLDWAEEFGDHLFDGFIGHFHASKSPLERAFLVGYVAHVTNAFDDLCDSDKFSSQYAVDNYRLDFAFFPDDLPIKVAIELDGHTYHERTVEQAVHDRARDRALQVAGWQVLRVHRAEIERDLIGCVDHIQTCISDICGSLIDSMTQG